MLPVNYAGLALILLGVAFFVAEAFVPSFGALGIGGVVAFALGALLLIDSDLPGFAIPWPLIGALALVSAAIVIGIASMAAKARRRPVISGAPRMIGAWVRSSSSTAATAGLRSRASAGRFERLSRCTQASAC